MPANYARFSQRLPQGTPGGGAFTNDNQLRSINSEDFDPDNLGEIASGAYVRLVPGTYRIRYSAPALGVGCHYVWIHNVTSAAHLAKDSANSHSNATNATQTRSEIVVEETFPVTTELGFYHWTQYARAVNGLGFPMGREPEIYAVVEVWKL